MLAVTQLHVHYGHVHALRGVSLEVPPGEMVAVVGANGAGKSTLMKAIMGLVRPSAGDVWYGDRRLTGEPAHRIVRWGLSLVPEGRRVFPDQTVQDNLVLGAYSSRAARGRDGVHADMARMTRLFPQLAERLNQPAGTLSGGEQQMLVLARGLMSRPTLLLIDEPSLGLAPIRVQEVFETLVRLRGEGLTILLVEQMAWMALEVCDRAYVFETGAVFAHGRGADLLADTQVLEAYLGRRAPSTGPAGL
ncbi:MAG: ABC transporter ATP-binding protein [Candidatus Rokuibacteriota bacterium]